MLAKDHSACRAVSPDIVDQSPLEGKKGIEVQGTEKVRGQGPRRLGEIEIGRYVRHRSPARE